MKKLVIGLFLLSLLSCDGPGVKNPTDGGEFIVQVDSVRYKIKSVSFGDGIGNIYIMVPEKSTVTLPQSILLPGDADGNRKTLIKVK